MPEKDPVAWNAMISGYAQVGESREALDLFHLMQLEGVKVNAVSMISVLSACTQLMKQDGVTPNAVTFVSVLRGCSVVGLVDEGQRHFDSMRSEFGIEPQLDQYGCLVDFYARAGRLEDAVRIIQQMPMKRHTAVGNLELGVLASKKMLELETKNHGAYVMLSNIYADSDNWDNVSHVRKSMKARGVRKEPGCSLMEVNGEVHEFFVGDNSHPRYTELEALAGYKSDTSPVMFNIDQEEKEDALCLHSEKAAIAFGIMSLKEDDPIRIVKNLRVSMMISKIFDREIIVRDKNRFHHFRDGHCSCNGFWRILF
ncbi:hypothetical protein Bca52824_084453 [Brassica carinata]|uniref:DYW domain-containing protein n=1 Tax=Brassica carinata TaxID=52824 RepID=A0A8X7PNP6_BRACI|nr:hypothetical protein Bca52824_084453 [Brassica carinata]